MNVTFSKLFFFVFNYYQVNIQRGKDIMDQNLLLLMKIKMVIGCWLEMYHGSKFFSLFYLEFINFSTKKEEKMLTDFCFLNTECSPIPAKG